MLSVDACRREELGAGRARLVEQAVASRASPSTASGDRAASRRTRPARRHCRRLGRPARRRWSETARSSTTTTPIGRRTCSAADHWPRACCGRICLPGALGVGGAGFGQARRNTLPAAGRTSASKHFPARLRSSGDGRRGRSGPADPVSLASIHRRPSAFSCPRAAHRTRPANEGSGTPERPTQEDEVRSGRRSAPRSTPRAPAPGRFACPAPIRSTEVPGGSSRRDVRSRKEATDGHDRKGRDGRRDRRQVPDLVGSRRHRVPRPDDVAAHRAASGARHRHRVHRRQEHPGQAGCRRRRRRRSGRAVRRSRPRSRSSTASPSMPPRRCAISPRTTRSW